MRFGKISPNIHIFPFVNNCDTIAKKKRRLLYGGIHSYA